MDPHVRGSQGDGSEPPSPSPTERCRRGEQGEIREPQHYRGDEPSTVSQGPTVSQQPRLEGPKQEKRRTLEDVRHAGLGRAIILPKASASGVAGSQSMTRAIRRSWAIRFARSIARIRYAIASSAV